ncbi:putative methyltransferase-domain-containing protein [Rhexocercosporidium sp. MPI-PUGE-AT-0058]|nr:putative methyltransferase-domain-containing protein [Rhexocercosporidium sp. MPI-PUGE-AT-0058]
MGMESQLSVNARRQLDRFCRQYLQVTLELDYPTEEYLRHDAFQQSLYSLLFSEDVQYVPPPRYQLRVLKELMKRIEASILDWDEEGISDDLMNCLAVLLSTSLPSEETSAQQKAYVTYSLSLLPPQPGPSPTITLHEARNILAAAGTTGLRTWEAGLHLGNYLCTNPDLIHQKSVLELGSGTGYLSILCAKYLEAGHVLATDGDGDVVASFSTNFYLNGLQEYSHIEGKELKWGHALTGGEDARWNLGRHIDLVLGADLTYDPRNIPPLVSTFGDLFELYPEVRILIAATVRSEETFEKFPDACKRNGYGFREVEFGVLKAGEQEGPFYSDLAPVRLCVITKT